MNTEDEYTWKDRALDFIKLLILCVMLFTAGIVW